MARQEQWSEDWEDEVDRLPRSRMSRSKRPPKVSRSQPQKKLFLARRALHTEGEQRIDRAMQKTLAVCPERPSTPYSGSKQGYHVSLLPPRGAFSIFQKYFLPSEESRDSAAFRRQLGRFNAGIANFVQHADREKQVKTYAGRILILETRKPYVALLFTDDEELSGVRQMKQQKLELYTQLTSDKRFSRHEVSSPTFPHLTLAQFVRLESAQAFSEVFAEHADELFAEPFAIEPVKVKKINLPPYFK